MAGVAQVIFTDRDNDELQVVLRENLTNHTNSADPVISIKNMRYGTTHSVVMTDEELDTVLKNLCKAFGYVAIKCEGLPPGESEDI